jgi:hypothetical protein
VNEMTSNVQTVRTLGQLEEGDGVATCLVLNRGGQRKSKMSALRVVAPCPQVAV